MLPYIDIPFIYVANALGSGPDELKLIVSFLLSYPLAAALKRIPDAQPAYKNLFIIGVSFFYLVGLFDLWTGLRTILIAAGGTYAIASYLRTSPYMPWIGFVFLMVHLSFNQLIRQYHTADPTIVDVTGAQMVLVMKLSAFCWNVADGALPKTAKLSEFQEDMKLVALPGLLDYLGYVFFFPALLAGPAMDFQEYKRWLDTSMFDVPANIDPSKRPVTKKRRRIPRSATPAMWKMGQGLVWILSFLVLSGSYSIPGLVDESFWTDYGFLKRLWILYFTNFVARMKYYGVWSLTEGSCILAGIGYNGVDPVTGVVSWDRLTNIRPWGVETAQNSRGYLEHWNIKTNVWLRNYIYLRVTPVGKKPGFRASMATFVTSAFWHGFYPGYYLTFVLASFIQTVAKNCRRYFRPFFIDAATQNPTPYKPYYDFATCLVTQLAFSFVTTPFLVLGFGDSIKVWARVYFYTVVGVVGFMGLFASPAKPWLVRQLKIRQQASITGTSSGLSGTEANKMGNATANTTTAAAVTDGGVISSGFDTRANKDGVTKRPKVVGPGLSSDISRELDEMMAEARTQYESGQMPWRKNGDVKASGKMADR